MFGNPNRFIVLFIYLWSSGSGDGIRRLRSDIKRLKPLDCLTNFEQINDLSARSFHLFSSSSHKPKAH